MQLERPFIVALSGTDPQSNDALRGSNPDLSDNDEYYLVNFSHDYLLSIHHTKLNTIPAVNHTPIRISHNVNLLFSILIKTAHSGERRAGGYEYDTSFFHL